MLRRLGNREKVHLARLEQEARGLMDQGVERGFVTCLGADGRLTRGPESSGHKYGVNIEVRCPADSTPLALFHTHPGGTTDMSPADIQETRRYGVPYCCIGVPETGQVVCHKVD